MAVLACDVCGGKLVMGTGGIAVCDSCGMEHSKDRMQEKVQEIKGTVTVSNIAGIESLMKRGRLALEDSDWKQADDYFGKVLDIDSEYAAAYIGKLCTELKLKNETEIANYKESVTSISNYKKALRFANADYRTKLEEYDRIICKSLEEAKRILPKARERIAKYKGCIAATSSNRTIGVKTDGTVVAVGNNKGYSDEGLCDVQTWKNVVSVYTNFGITVGLKADNTIIVISKDKYDNYDYYDNKKVFNWQDIIDVAKGESYLVGLRSDGNLVGSCEYMPNNKYEYEHRKRRLGGITSILGEDFVAINFSDKTFYGLKEDGTIISFFTEREKTKWTNIVAIDDWLALKADGTVVPIDSSVQNSYSECFFNDWRDIVAIAAGGSHVVGLKADGKVVATGKNDDDQCNTSGWRDIVAIAAGYSHTVGVKADGTVVAVGDNKYGQCDVSNWRNIGGVSKEQLIQEMEKQRKQEQEAKRRQEEEQQRHRKEQEEQRRIEQSKQWKEQGLCQYCGGKLSLLGRKCKSCGKEN